jgi:hypothetical protein
MNFLNPTLALVGLACVAIPIAIHILMRRRRKPVAWAAMRFLMEAYQQQRRRLRLEQLLLLAARCLVIALVALALGRPFFGQAAALGGRSALTLYLLVDNGLASSAQEPGQSAALERHKAAAAALLGQLEPTAGDRAALVALGGPAQALVVPPTSDTAALRDLVRNLEATASATDIGGGLGAVAQNLAEGRGGSRIIIAILSDFLAGSADPDRTLSQIAAGAGEGGSRRDTMLLLASNPADSSVDNITITAVEPLRPVIIASRRTGEGAQPAPVRIVLRRTGAATGEAASTTVQLAIETDRGASTPVGRTVVRWAPGQSEATAAVPMETGAIASGGAAGPLVLTASIDADAIAGDNVWRRPIEVRRALRVGIVAPRRLSAAPGGARTLQQFESADWVHLALSPIEEGTRGSGLDAEIEAVQIEPGAVDGPRLAGLDAAIITRPDMLSDPAWSRLRAFADSGGLIVVVPPHQAQVHLWPDAMVRELGLTWSIGREARVFEQGAMIATDRSAPEMQVGAGRNILAMLQAELPELARPVRVNRALVLEGGEGLSTTVLRLQDGTPLLAAQAPGARDAAAEGAPASRGLVVLLTTAFAFEWTDLQARPLMVPLLQEVVRQGVGQAIGTSVQLAGTPVEFPARTVELRSAGAPAGAALIVRPAPGSAPEPLRQSGLWQAMDERGIVRSLVAVNADPAGGRTDAQAEGTIRDWLGSALPGVEVRWLDGPDQAATAGGSPGALHAIFDRRGEDSMLPIWLLAIALAIAVLELAMGRWFSHAVRTTPVSPLPAVRA